MLRFSLTNRAAASAIIRRRSASARGAATALANALGSRGGVKSPPCPSSTTSATPPSRPATTGTPRPGPRAGDAVGLAHRRPDVEVGRGVHGRQRVPPGSGRRSGRDLRRGSQHRLDRGPRRAVADHQQLPRHSAQLAEGVGREARRIRASRRRASSPRRAARALRVQAEAPGERAAVALPLGARRAIRRRIDERRQRRSSAGGTTSGARHSASTSVSASTTSAARIACSVAAWPSAQGLPAAWARTTPRRADRGCRARP